MDTILDPLNGARLPDSRFPIGGWASRLAAAVFRTPARAVISLVLILVLSGFAPTAIAQDLPPAPPEPAATQPEATPAPARRQQQPPPPRASTPTQALTSSSSSQDKPGSSIKLPDVSDWTAQDAIDYAQQNRLIVLGVIAGIVFIFLWLGNLIGPGSTPKLSGRDVKPFPAPIWLFAALLTYISVPLAIQFLAELPQLKSGNTLRDEALVKFGGVGAGCLTGFALLFVMAKTAGGAGLRIKMSDAPIGIGCFLLALPFVLLAADGATAMYANLTGETPPVLAHPTLETIVANRHNQWAILLAVVAVVGSPIFEEIVWRGFLQSAVLRATGGNPWPAILTTSILFALIHRASSDPVPWHALAPIFTLGVAMGIAYERTKRLGVPIVMHVCFNGLNVGLALAQA